MAKLTQARLHHLINYNPDTGAFVWRQAASPRTRGRAARCINAAGYVVIRIDGVLYLGHRLAWLYVHGAFPSHEIDHENGTRSDNRISNLRSARHSENSKNLKLSRANSSGFKGVHRHSDGRWRARIKVDGRHVCLGVHCTAEAAARAYDAGAVRYHGDYAATNVMLGRLP